MSRRAFAPPGQRGCPTNQVELPTMTRGDETGLSTPPSGHVDSVPGSLPLAVREVLGLPIRLLRAMPLPTTLVCSFAHGGGCVVLATVPPPSVPGDPPAPVFVGPELDALALAAEHGRAYAATLRGWCEKRAKMPDWRLTSLEALGKLGHPTPPLGWTTAQVLRALGLQLDEVRL